ncbi:hypothetical protein BgiMline_031261 [Biomphalaria glabrata]|nr:hypothetical protein BgiMline_019500 [Biomphalaria glabrata]
MGSSPSSLANSTRFDYGTHETVNLSDNTSSEENCVKPHDNYRQILKFSMEYLPEEYRENDLYELVKSMAGLTVRISVMYSSKKRMKRWYDTDQLYPGYECRGSKTCLLGSGRIADVYQDSTLRKLCQCPQCRSRQDSGRRETWIVLVFTAIHVVYDDTEGKKSKLKLLYDCEPGGSKLFHGATKRWSSTAGDLCLLECVTCDKAVAEELSKNIKYFNKLWRSIEAKYLEDTKLAENDRKYQKRLVIIVSHPHGGDKKISVGHVISQETRNIKTDFCYNWVYDAQTCKGSSGAPVYVFGQNWFKEEYVHSGGNTTVNYSTFWSERDKQ